MNMQTRLNQLMSFQENLKQKISNLPEGELCIYQSPPYQKWICSLPGKQKYLSKKNQPLAEALALKKYYSLLLAETEEELSLLNFYIKSHEKKDSAANHSKPLTSSDLLTESSPYYPLLQGYFAKDKLPVSMQKWCAESYETNSSHPENLIHTTLAGHKVRSKSEVIIANLLYTNHIPYRYEAALALNELTVYPDFTILHPTTQQFFYWEHFGMMDKNNYCDAACNKLKSYCYNGIFPSMQLITTYETGKVPIRSEQVQQIITQYFLWYNERKWANMLA